MKKLFIVLGIIIGLSLLIFLSWPWLIRNEFFSKIINNLTNEEIKIERLASNDFERQLIETAEATPCSWERDCFTREDIEYQIQKTKNLNKGINVPADKKGYIFSLHYRASLKGWNTSSDYIGSSYKIPEGSKVSPEECFAMAGEPNYTVEQFFNTGSKPNATCGLCGSGSIDSRNILYNVVGEPVCQQKSNSISGWISRR